MLFFLSSEQSFIDPKARAPLLRPALETSERMDRELDGSRVDLDLARLLAFLPSSSIILVFVQHDDCSQRPPKPQLEHQTRSPKDRRCVFP